MKSLLITPDSPADLRLLKNLFKRLNIAFKVLSDDDKQDLGLALLIREAVKGPKFSAEEVKRKLDSV